MLLVNMQIIIDLPYASSLKGRRKIVHSIKEKLTKYNISILDLSSEYIKEAELAIAFLALSQKDIAKKIKTIEKILDNFISEIEYTINYEVL